VDNRRKRGWPEPHKIVYIRGDEATARVHLRAGTRVRGRMMAALKELIGAAERLTPEQIDDLRKTQRHGR